MLPTRLPRSGLSAALALLLALPLAAVAGPAPAAARTSGPAVTVAGLTTERATNPIGLDTERPRLGWTIDSTRRGVLQHSYQVRVASSPSRLDRPDVWDSGRVTSRNSTLVPYAGPAPKPRTRYAWQVRIWDETGRVSGWSEPAYWETGVGGPDGWQGDWIGLAPPTESWVDYTVQTTVRVERDAAGIFLRASGAGNAYMWQFSTTDGSATLRPHVRVNGAWTVLKEVSLAAVVPPEKLTAPHTLRIAAAGDTFTTWVDGVQVDVTRHAAHRSGSVGLRTSTQESAVFADFSVTDGDRTLYAAPLTDGENPFGAGTPTADGLRVSGDTETMLAALDANPLLRRGFRVAGEVARARVYASGLGVYQLSLNGERVGDHELAPGWTDYAKRVQYQSYDVTGQLRPGDNAFGAMLGDGWYSGSIAWFGTDNYGPRPLLSAALVIDYADGRTETVRTDGSWRATPGPFLLTDLIHGETYDARRLPAGWDRPGFDDSGWSAATVGGDGGATARLVAQVDPPVRVTQELKATALTQPTPGTWIFDLGQNMVGKVRLKVAGPAGTTVRIRHAEVLNPDGTAYTANLRTARATDLYRLRGGGPEVYEPTFTFHGFRYVELTGFPGTPDLGTVTGLVMHTDGERTSTFATSNPMVNQLHSNITWGQRGNFLSIPTDTPARDERLGWTGDINVFAETATFNMESLTFLTKWLADLRDAQSGNGAYPDVAPRACCGDGATGWADAGITVPHALWQRYGDTRVIEEHYDSMVRYAAWLESTSSGHRRTNAGPYLDWLNLDDPTPAGVIGTAYYAYSIRLLGEMAGAIGRTADAERYAALSARIAEAFTTAYVAADGTVQGDSQTGYVLAIGMDLLPDALRGRAADRLVANLERHDWHLATGFLGTPDLLPALADTGHLDVAYRLLLNDTYPSWGYEIGKGATTIWERWNSIMPDGSFGDVSMNSFNHYAYGAVGDWMYRTVAGIQPDPAHPGYAHLTIAPRPGGDIRSAKASYRSIRGTVGTDWRLDDRGQLRLAVTVPGNTTATVRIPAASRHAVTEGGRPAERAEGVRFVRLDGGDAVFEVGSGRYAFAVDRVLGDLGEAADAVTEAATVADQVAGELHWPPAIGLRVRLARLTVDAAAARLAYRYGEGDARATGAAVHRALATGSDLDRWLETQVRAGRMPRAVADRFAAPLTRLDQRLSAASSALVGAVARLDLPVGEVLPGGVLRAAVLVQNGGTETVTGLVSTVDAGAGVTVRPVGSRPGSVAPGRTVRHEYELRIPPGQPVGTLPLTASAGYRYRSGTATLPLAGSLPVAPAVTVVSTTAEPASVAPGGTATLHTVLRNRSTVPVRGELTGSAPDGWRIEPGSRPFALAPGAEVTLEGTVTAPLATTEGAVGITVATGPTEAERRRVDLPVRFDNPPGTELDHVDLGATASEQAHRLLASEHSDSSVEAGLTRRYTNVTHPGGWFEFDLAVPAGRPFLLRVVETYDSAQSKDYDVLVDGARVHARAYQRTAGGAGTVSYQFVVDRPESTADGTVRVRFQDTGEGYDPSIADVWSVPLPAAPAPPPASPAGR
ncbi:alfa-L-rhamnosidase [Plantactinospora sp. BC1]|uniref:alpha-L-rhamnosidase n=1 Tax=Plantactinospora sp. BC1 TaxID=2108470 RepID=UPI000D1555EF|nr:alpha-L-rhamnosidase [Plantactinospora sp. BC1]AVT31775.1 alfa-L-rhamnosidase [Plantactinospora sp. BC1]